MRDSLWIWIVAFTLGFLARGLLNRRFRRQNAVRIAMIEAGLRAFAERLEDGESIDCMQIERVMTADGPMHIATEGTLRIYPRRGEQ
jgi:hypothetical protein